MLDRMNSITPIQVRFWVRATASKRIRSSVTCSVKSRAVDSNMASFS
jgi:hypothetical protein